MRLLSLFMVSIFTMLLAVSPTRAYIHFPPTSLPKMCEMSQNIRVMKVTKFDKDKGIILFEVTDTLKGIKAEKAKFKHVFADGLKGQKPILDWLEEGKKVVMFTIEVRTKENDLLSCGYVFIDKYCYSVDYSPKTEAYYVFRTDPELAAIFNGTVEQLQTVTKDLLAGKKDVKIPVDEKVKILTIEERTKFVKEICDFMIKNREK